MKWSPVLEAHSCQNNAPCPDHVKFKANSVEEMNTIVWM